MEQWDCLSYLSFENVPLSKLDSVEPLLRSTLLEVMTKTVDTERMSVIVERRISELLSLMESDPSEAVAGFAIGDFLYGICDFDVSLWGF